MATLTKEQELSEETLDKVSGGSGMHDRRPMVDTKVDQKKPRPEPSSSPFDKPAPCVRKD